MKRVSMVATWATPPRPRWCGTSRRPPATRPGWWLCASARARAHRRYAGFAPWHPAGRSGPGPESVAHHPARGLPTPGWPAQARWAGGAGRRHGRDETESGQFRQRLSNGNVPHKLGELTPATPTIDQDQQGSQAWRKPPGTGGDLFHPGRCLARNPLVLHGALRVFLKRRRVRYE
jgi:hypothetical protein